MLHHAPDAVDALRDDARGPPARGCFDLAPKMYDPVGDRDGYIQSFQTRVLPKANKDAAPNGFIASCRLILPCGKNRLQQVGATDDADQFSISYYRDALDAAFPHQTGNTLDGRILIDGGGFGRHDVANPPRTSPYKRGGPIIGVGHPVAHQYGCFTAELRSPEQVALADDAQQVSFIVDDWYAAHVMFEHKPGGLPDAVVRRQFDDFGRHDIFDEHVDTYPRKVPSR